MAPVKKIKTYGGSSKRIVNSSVDAINVLFAKNKAKARQNKKRKLFIKELPIRPRGETLLGDDSMHISTEDTFDKLLGGNKHCCTTRSQVNVRKDDSSISQSFKQVNSFYSPIMTRRRKRIASIVEISDHSSSSRPQAKKNKGNKSLSVIPHFLEPTVDNIDFSLEVEKAPKVVPNSLSYIKLPGVRGREISDDLVRESANMTKAEISFDPIFTKTFREKQMIHCSTPLMPLRVKEKIVNHTISPINNSTFPKKSVSRKIDIYVNSDVSVPKNLSITNTTQSTSTNVDYNSKRKLSDWKLKGVPKVLLSICPEMVQNYEGPESIQSSQNSFVNANPSGIINSAKLRESFITLRKRKVLKHTTASKRERKSENKNMSESLSTDKNLTMSLSEFNSFVDKINENDHKTSQKIHSLYEFESFVAQNKHLLGITDNIDTSPKKEYQVETPIHFVTKRRRRLTDSFLSKEASRNLSEIPKRRFSLQESTSNAHPKIVLKDMVVLIPRVNLNCQHNKTDSCNDINSLIPMIDRGNTYSQVDEKPHNGTLENSRASIENAMGVSDVNNAQHKRLIVNITKVNLGIDLERETYPVEMSVVECTDSLFGNSDNYVNNTSHQTASLQSEVMQSNTSAVAPNSDYNKIENTSKRIMPEKNIRDSRKESSTNTQAIQDVNVGSVELTNSSINVIDKLGRSKSASKSSKNSIVIVDTTLKNNSGNLLQKNKDFPAEDFENFFVNVTKRSGSSKCVADKLQSSEVSDIRRHTTEAEKCGQFFVGLTQNVDPVNIEISEDNLVVNETQSDSLRQVSDAQEFEDFFTGAMKLACESETGQYVMNYGHNDVNIEREIIVNLIKSPWRRKGNKSDQVKADGTLVDLTASADDNCLNRPSTSLETQHLKEEVCGDPPIIIDNSHSQEISDIIESSLQEPGGLDTDGFRIPTIGGVHKKQSKTVLLKTGKLWRRSLSIYKRSSIMLSLMNVGTCVAIDGSYCLCPKCKLSRDSKRLSHRRCSIRIVPTSPAIDHSKETSILENYAHSASYVSGQILEDNLEDNLRSLSISKRRSSIIQNSAPVTARELVLRRCGQPEPIPFEECYPKSTLLHCQKIGEGVYGEVFLFRNPNGGTSVIKVIPIEGDQIVNGERQKKFEEIFSEIIIAQELSNLRNNKQNTTSGFSEVQKVQCVQGRYPEKLLDLWDLYDETRGSENDSPEIFGEEQLYIVLQLANGGQDLEAFIFNNSLQAYTMFQQVACALAIAEEQLRFEHRDLHWGNILLSPVDKNKKVNFRLDGKDYDIMMKGVQVSIIDFTLSRIEYDGVVIFNDLGLDPDLFTAEGDYQFEIYKLMQKKNGNNWQRFEPYTNILWLHYTLDKAITALRYKNVQTKIHKEYIGKLKQLKNDILNYGSVKDFVLNNF